MKTKKLFVFVPVVALLTILFLIHPNMGQTATTYSERKNELNERDALEKKILTEKRKVDFWKNDGLNRPQANWVFVPLKTTSKAEAEKRYDHYTVYNGKIYVLYRKIDYRNRIIQWWKGQGYSKKQMARGWERILQTDSNVRADLTNKINNALTNIALWENQLRNLNQISSNDVVGRWDWFGPGWEVEIQRGGRFIAYGPKGERHSGTWYCTQVSLGYYELIWPLAMGHNRAGQNYHDYLTLVGKKTLIGYNNDNKGSIVKREFFGSRI